MQFDNRPLPPKPLPGHMQPMHHPLTLADVTLHALPSGALYLPAQQTLVVSDLHLGKSERMARRGGPLLPPYETRATLAKLAADIATCAPATVICLGDSFDDMTASQGLDPKDHLHLAHLITGQNWVWIAGNHDAGPTGLGGSHAVEIQIGPLTLRHIADPAGAGELSGHYHPKARLAGRSRPCFLADAARVILPAYGTYTGGLYSHDPALTALMLPRALAILTGPKALAIPMPRKAPSPRP